MTDRDRDSSRHAADPAAEAVGLARPAEGERVLDLSGRAGSLALQVAATAASVEAVQPDEDLAGEGRRLARTLGRTNVYFHSGPLSALPFDEGQFDLAFWCMGLSREPRPAAALREVRRVLGSGGRLLLQDVTALERARTDLWVWELERRRDPAHLLYYSQEQIEELVRGADLRIVGRRSTAVTTDFEYWIDSAQIPAGEVPEIKQSFFRLPLDDQDRLDLSLADGRISFSYPVVTLLLEA